MADLANDALLESWTLSLHSKSARTKVLYLRILGWFADWLERSGRPEARPGDLVAVSRQDVEAWFTHQRDAGMAVATVRSRWIALRSFYKWAVEEDEIADNPMMRVKVDKADPPPRAMLTTDELRALLKACEGKEFLDRRDYALVRLLAATGLRISEVRDLTLADLDLSKRLVFVAHGKGDRARFARFDAETANALDRYRRARARHRHAGNAALWLSRLGKLTTNGITDALQRRAAMAGIGHLHAHMFRHGFADRFLSNGGNESDLMRLGGWSSQEVMRRYGSARAVDRALAAYDDVNPLAGL